MPFDLATATTREVYIENGAIWATQVDRSALEVGNIEKVIIFHSVNQELMKLVASCPKVSEVILVEPAEDVALNEVMAPLETMKSLKSLELNMVRVNPHDSMFLASLHQLSEFRTEMLLYERDFYGLGRLPALEVLEISQVVKRSEKRDTPRQLFSQLRELTIGSADLLDYFKDSEKLERLHVHDPVMASDVKYICGFKALKELSLTVQDFSATERLRDLPDLTRVNLTIRRPPSEEIE